ncbi:MAG TPA: helix-turn-helix domain-containing protein [Fimbriiglobus sp.]|nr:helix-turn-helix domain-containing protein [Fimbriiglobus sp.]
MTVTRKRSTTLAAVYGKEKDRYMELIRLFPLRPIRSDDELDTAVAVVHSLIDQDRMNKAELDYLDVLDRLVEKYEDATIPLAPVSDADMLRSFLDSHRVTQAEVAKGAGIAESTVSEVLSGKRKLTRKQIGKLARYFRVEPGVFAFPE